MSEPEKDTPPPEPPQPPRVAVVGGGITGAVAAAALAKAGLAVAVFDQGRRGPDGRASHRRVCDGRVVPDDDLPPGGGTLEFDHGCQFFRADDPRMQALVEAWCASGWAAEWRGRFGHIRGAARRRSDLRQRCGRRGWERRFLRPAWLRGVGGACVGWRGRDAAAAKGRAGPQRGDGAPRRAGQDPAPAGVQPLGAAGDLRRGRLPRHGGGNGSGSGRGLTGGLRCGRADEYQLELRGLAQSLGGPSKIFCRARVRRARLPLFSCMVAYSAPLGLPIYGLTIHTGGVL